MSPAAAAPQEVTVTCMMCQQRRKGKRIDGVVVFLCPTCDCRTCGKCKRPVESPTARRCPACRAVL